MEKSAVLEVIFYKTTEDLTNVSIADNPLIICPSPLVADGLRRLMPENSEIVTISKWVSDYLKSKNLKRSNKAELMLRLSSVWRHYFPSEEAHLFFKSFELFTDLRSFSLDLELLMEFLLEVDEVTKKSVLIFWTFLQNEKLIDEHLSYQIVSEMKQLRPVWIIGFKHLNGIQIDMLKTISEQVPVNVFFPRDVYAETLSTDWIRWLVPEIKLDSVVEAKKLKIIHFPKNKLNIVLDSLKKLIPQFDLSLASQNLSLNSRQEVATAQLFFKSQEDIFKIQRELLIETFSEELQSGLVTIDEFQLRIEENKKDALLNENFILYKVLLLLSEASVAYAEFQATVDIFSLKVFKTILELNSPRVALATMLPNPKDRLLELNELPYLRSDRPLVLVASSNYGALKTTDGKYSEKMINALKAIAPVKRSGLDFLYLKSELNQTLRKEGSILLMEEGLELIDLSWREILKGFQLETINPKATYQLKPLKDYLSSLIKPGPFEVKNISASRLQLFMDCPRKYYFSYVEKIDHRPLDRLKIAPDEMGIIEHEIIQIYFKNKSLSSSLIFDQMAHETLCRLSLEKFLSSHRIVLTEKARLVTFYELVNYTRNGIEFLIEYCKKNNATEIEFEYSLGMNQWNLIGSIDCLIYMPENQVSLFDFKRSGAAIGSKRDTLIFEKIQIWVYLLVIKKQQLKSIQSWGYLNLSEIEASQIYNEDEAVILKDATFDEFQVLLVNLIEAMKNEIQFYPKPRNKKVCSFCEVELFCSKGSC